MKILIYIIGLIIGVVVSALISIYIYRNVIRLWDCKREKVTTIEKLQVIIYTIIETNIFQSDRSYILAAIRILAEEVYDYIVIRDPCIEIANQILREKTVLEIIDYWNSPVGRILKVKIGTTKHNKENIIIVNIKNIEKQSFKIEKLDIKDKGPKLRIIK